MPSSAKSAHLPGSPKTRAPLDLQGSLLMLVFCLAVGIQQVAIKTIAADIAPLAQIAIRSTIAALLVMAVARARGVGVTDVRACLLPGMAAGLCFAIEFGFVAYGLNYTTASHMSVFLYTAPVFAALGLHFLVPGEQLMRRHWVGIAIAFAGIVLAMAPTGQNTGGPSIGSLIIGDMLGMIAGMGWAATTVVIRTSSLSEQRPTLTLSYQLVFAVLVLLPLAGFMGNLSDIRITPTVLAIMAFETFGIAFGILLLWFSLLRRYLASRLGVFSFLSPVFGVLFGVVLLGDPLTWAFCVGGLAILAGVIIVSAPVRQTAPPKA